ncbi:MAG: UPF0489 family protein [Myxococcaceae bacterium]|nr:UPF0489 family protein [Myxococcaceae bacterium]MCA3011040.1 UPF0489 family protein [Myxococcaceae bacterium]
MSFPGIIELSLRGRGPGRGFLFDPHRLAFPCWAEAVERPAVLVTFDRHFDLVPPAASVPMRPAPAEADAFARTHLDPRNVDHVIAAMEAGLVTDALVVARAWPVGAHRGRAWTSRAGVEHRLVGAPTLERLLEDPVALQVLERAEATLLDFDLDCFVTPSDADPFTVVPWPRDLVRDFLCPAGGERFWALALARCRALTIAREPNHCGGVIASNRLFEAVAQVVFAELLETDLP